MDGVITSLYGKRVNPVLLTDELHDGIDIYNKVGTDVVSVAKGVVTEVRYSETYGNVLVYEILDHNRDTKIEVFYGHLDKILVSVGDNVLKGEVVGKSGDSGLTTGPHLHYTILIDDKSIDPFDFVKLKMTEEVAKEVILE